jgi:diadenosine tetraphosphatase ApaH/serine/threonine PP2A family protein phosphatase
LEGNSNEIKLEKDVRYLINPGSVGQPRDRNYRVACAIYDSDARKIVHRSTMMSKKRRKILASSHRLAGGLLPGSEKSLLTETIRPDAGFFEAKAGNSCRTYFV